MSAVPSDTTHTMTLTIVLALLALGLNSCHAETSRIDYLYWIKDYIITWHRYFPSRVITEERLTLEKAQTAVLSLSDGLNASLAGVVAFQTQELESAKQLMAGTDGQGCVTGIADYMTKAINDAVTTYENCAADALQKLQRLNTTWTTARSKYLAVYKRALDGIDACARYYPNKGDMDRLKLCVEYMSSTYFAAANDTQNSMFPSPSMSYVQDVVIGCSSNAAAYVVAKGFQFIKMLIECAKLSGKIDVPSYSEQLNQWQGCNDTLQNQISEAQDKNYNQVWTVETQMQNYYAMERMVLEHYFIESRGRDFYMNSMYKFLSDYYNTVTATSLDNPGDGSCSDLAKVALDDIANLGTNESLACDLEIVNTTKQLISDVNRIFERLNNLMPSIGNAAILNCIAQGYIFAPNTIHDCFTLVSTDFDLEYQDSNTIISKHVSELSGLLQFFYGKNELPCGGTEPSRLLLTAEGVLYRLQRCLYISSGTAYSVTTPATFTYPYYTSTSTPV